MKLLLDSCVWGGAKPELLEAGHDVVWTGDWPKDPGDTEILSRAFAEQRILVTLDKDFGELAIVKGHPHGGIIRLVGFGARQQARECLNIMNLHESELLASAIITAEPGRYRIRLKD